MHFVLDQNFPLQLTSLDWPPPIRLTRLARIEPELTRNHDDWEIFRTLDNRGDINGFITNDADILQLAREMVVLSRSRLTLVVTDGVGHDAIRATGLIMVHLQEISRRVDGRPQIYVLRPNRLEPVPPGRQINKIAARAGIPPNQLISQELAAIDDLLR